MKKLVFAFGIISALTAGLVPAAQADNDTNSTDRLILNFNPDWKFIKDNPPDAQSTRFRDRNWESVSTPHTYNDVDTFDDLALPGLRGETNQWGGKTWYRKTFTVPKDWTGRKVYIEFEAVRQVAEVYLNGHYLGACKNGFIPFGFDLTPYLQFGRQNVLAVMCDNQFVFNPLRPAKRRRQAEPPPVETAVVNPSTNDVTASDQPTNDVNQVAAPAMEKTEADKTETAKESEPTMPTNSTPIESLLNVQAKVNASVPTNVADLRAGQVPWNSPQWHPAMGGIYRNVKLIVTDPLHLSLPIYDFLQTEGPYIYSTDISQKSATVNFEIPIENGRSKAANFDFVTQVFDREGKAVLTIRPVLARELTLGPGQHVKYKVSATLTAPQLWQPDYPYLYHAVITLRSGGQVVDTCEIPFGIRTVSWNVKNGFMINGNHLRLHGWGQKPVDEWPGLGDAMPDWMHFYTLQMMKDAGGNWVRWGHCAGGPAQIEACDQLGLAVEQPGVDGESDTVRAAWRVRSDAFRDAIIFYRNNPAILVWEGGNQKVTTNHAAELRGYVDQYDPHGGRAYAHRRADKSTGDYMDVTIGTEGSHEVPRLPVVEGEYDREESPRRVWDTNTPPNEDYVATHKGQTYVLTSEQFAINEVRQYVRKVTASTHSGGANWIFSDSTSGGRNTLEVDRASGEVDGVRLPKEAYYACQTMFRDEPGVHIIGHWNYPAGTRKTVYIVSNCEDVELVVNGQSLGQGRNVNKYLFVFKDVEFSPGEIKAVGYNKGTAAADHSIKTAGDPVALRLTPILGPGGFIADGSDIALFDVEAVDANGQRCPTVQQRVDFTCAGPAIWRGGYNSGKTNSINWPYVDLECGINRVAIRSTRKDGEITVNATSQGLQSASVTIQSTPLSAENGYTPVLPLKPTTELAAKHASWANLTRPMPPMVTSAMNAGDAWAGKYIESFAYTGPNETASVQPHAANGSKIYSDQDYTFTELPKPLIDADYVQVPNADALYSAVDLMQLVITEGTDVYVAHDARLDTPEWLTNQFKPVTNITFNVNNQPMLMFRHPNRDEGSITLGSNSEEAGGKEANAYIVFVTAAPKTNALDTVSATNAVETNAVAGTNVTQPEPAPSKNENAEKINPFTP